MSLALLQELLMALWFNNSDSCKSLSALGMDQIGKDVAAEVESDWMVPLLVEEWSGRLMPWQMELSHKIH